MAYFLAAAFAIAKPHNNTPPTKGSPSWHDSSTWIGLLHADPRTHNRKMSTQSALGQRSRVDGLKQPHLLGLSGMQSS